MRMPELRSDEINLQPYVLETRRREGEEARFRWGLWVLDLETKGTKVVRKLSSRERLVFAGLLCLPLASRVEKGEEPELGLKLLPLFGRREKGFVVDKDKFTSFSWIAGKRALLFKGITCQTLEADSLELTLNAVFLAESCPPALSGYISPFRPLVSPHIDPNEIDKYWEERNEDFKVLRAGYFSVELLREYFTAMKEIYLDQFKERQEKFKFFKRAVRI